MRSARISRRSANNSLESRSPRMRYAGSRITAAATTGPNSEPRPTSSTPATKRAPNCHIFFSNLSVQRSFLSRRSLTAEAESDFAESDLSFSGTEQESKPQPSSPTLRHAAQCGKPLLTVATSRVFSGPKVTTTCYYRGKLTVVRPLVTFDSESCLHAGSL